MSDFLDYLKTNLLIATANIAKYRHLCASIDFFCFHNLILLGYNPAIEVTTGEVAQYFCDVNSQKLSAIQFGNGKEIKGIGYGVGETTEDEDGYAKQHRKELLCSTKLDGGSHNKTTADGKEKACQRTFIKPRLHNGHIGRQDVGLGIGCCKCRDATGDNVAYKDKENCYRLNPKLKRD